MRKKLTDFCIEVDRFSSEHEKAFKYLSLSWELKDEDREIANLFYKKHDRKRGEHMDRLIQIMKEIISDSV